MKNFFNLQRFVEEYTNTQPNKTLTGTSAADYFDNSGSIVKIYGLGGNDTVQNTGSVVTIAAGDGNNSVSSFGSNVSITAGKGNDDIENYTSDDSSTEKVKMLVGDGNNSVFSSSESSYVTIVSGKGVDSVRTYSDNAKISVGAGDDSVWNDGSITDGENYGNSVSAVLGAGHDYFYNRYGNTVKVNGGAGNDCLENEGGTNVTLSGGTGDDVIYNSYRQDASNLCHGNYASMSGGTGEDTIYNEGYYYEGIDEGFYGSYSTITGGKGDDIVSLNSYSNSMTIQYTYGDGNDTIFGFDSDDTLQIATNKKFTTMSSGSDLFIMFDNDEVITLKDVDLGVGGISSKNFVTVKGGNDSGGSDEGWAVSGTTATYSNSSGKTLITLSGLKSGLKVSNGAISGITLKNKTVTLAQNVLGSDKAASVNGGGYNYILGGAGKLTNVGKAATLTGSSGKDTLIGGTGKDTIYGGAGNDILSGGNGNDKLFGDTGNDSLNGGKGNDTLTAGAGNDTLTGGKGSDVFVHSKGADVITDYTAGTDKIKLSGVTLKSSKVSGKDVVLTTSGGTVTVKNAKGKELDILMTVSSSTSGLLAENNFIVMDDLRTIVQNNVAITDEIQIQNFDKLNNENNFIVCVSN